MNTPLNRSDYFVFSACEQGNADTTASKLLGFADLKPGWHCGTGEGFDRRSIETALKFHRTLNLAGHTDTDAFPGLSGEIQISVYALPRSCELLIESTGRWSLVFEKDGQEMAEKSGSSFAHQQDSIIEAVNSWITPTFLLGGIGNRGLADSPAWPSSLPRLTEESRLSKWHVSWQPQVPFVRTSGNGIRMLLGSPQSTGSSLRVSYPNPFRFSPA